MKTIVIFIGIMLIISITNAQNTISEMSPEMEDVNIQIIRLEDQLQTLKHKRDSLEMVELNKNLKINEATIIYVFNYERCQYDKTSICYNEKLPYVTIVFYYYNWYTDEEPKETRRIQYQNGNLKFASNENFINVLAPDGTTIEVIKEFKL